LWRAFVRRNFVYRIREATMADTPSSSDKPSIKKIETAEKLKVEKVEHKEIKEIKTESKEKPEKIELKEKPEKIEHKEKPEKTEHKEKPEKIEHKEKPEKFEHKEKPEKTEHKEKEFKIEHKENTKIEVREKQINELQGKDLVENQQTDPGGQVEQRLAALEQSMVAVNHFITTGQRPDLSRGALAGEADQKKS
jgi:hypothetical protein